VSPMDAHTLQLFCQNIHKYMRCLQVDGRLLWSSFSSSDRLFENILLEYVCPFLSSRNIQFLLLKFCNHFERFARKQRTLEGEVSDILEKFSDTWREIESNTTPTTQSYQDTEMFEASMATLQEEGQMKRVPSISSLTQPSHDFACCTTSYSELEDMRTQLDDSKETRLVEGNSTRDEEIMSKEEEESIKEELRMRYANTKILMELREDIMLRSMKAKLPSSATRVMQAWCVGNLHNPYPTKEEKAKMAESCGLDFTQVDDWFTNYRKRLWKRKVKSDA